MSAAEKLGHSADSLTVLIADDDITNRLVLQGILSKQGYQSILAENGQQAVEAFQQHQPDLVLMDVMMPVLDGYEAARRIKSICNDRFVPVIFLTAITDEQALYKCVQSGGDDFLTKPYNHVILHARMNALLRIRDLYNTIHWQNIKISHHQNQMELEARMAETLFRNIVHSPALEHECIRYILDSMSLFNGDMLLAEFKPSGGIHLLLGDFTGHGLTAATGALPASTVFYEMTRKAYSLTEIIKEMNKRVKQFLPTGMFLAAGFLDIDIGSRTAHVWNGGLPDILVYNQGGIQHRFQSTHLPLGVVDSSEFDDSVEMLHLEDCDRFYLYSDGITEAHNKHNERFGQQRLDQLFSKNLQPEQVFGQIRRALDSFRSGCDQSDDVTFVEFCFDPVKFSREFNNHVHSDRASLPALNWDFSFNLQADVLRNADPLPIVIRSIAEIQGLNNRRQQLYTLLAELYSNALEHGLLGLDSSLKSSPEGFAQYYQLRKERLAALRQGYIHIRVKHTPTSDGGRLVLQLEDSGPGFYYRARLRGDSLPSNSGYHGRGLPLMEKLCDRIEYSGCGNIVTATYLW